MSKKFYSFLNIYICCWKAKSKVTYSWFFKITVNNRFLEKSVVYSRLYNTVQSTNVILRRISRSILNSVQDITISKTPKCISMKNQLSGSLQNPQAEKIYGFFFKWCCSLAIHRFYFEHFQLKCCTQDSSFMKQPQRTIF